MSSLREELLSLVQSQVTIPTTVPVTQQVLSQRSELNNFLSLSLKAHSNGTVFKNLSG